MTDTKRIEEAVQVLKDLSRKIYRKVGGINDIRWDALQTLISLAQDYLKIRGMKGMPKEMERDLSKCVCGLNDAICYHCIKVDNYNNLIKDCTLAIQMKLENLERIIAEFIPHRDSQYIKPLVSAIKDEMFK